MLLLALLLAASDVGPDLGGVAPGTPISSRQIVRHDVFDVEDPATSSWPYRAANALHIVSQERYVRSLLLFREGDPLDPDLLAESARLLRASGFLSPVFITARPAAGGAEVTVETRDQWTTEAGLSLSLAGGQNDVYVRFEEENFLGWGKQVGVGWRSDPERDATILRYGDPLFLGTRWQIAAEYQDASDGSVEAFRLAYPFYALATPRTAGFDWRHQRRTEYLWSDGEKAVEGRADRERFSLWGGIRLPSGPSVTNRLTVGLFSQRGYNIETLNVAPTEDPTLSRLTLTTVGDDRVLEQITKQLNKLVDVYPLRGGQAGIRLLEAAMPRLKLVPSLCSVTVLVLMASCAPRTAPADPLTPIAVEYVKLALAVGRHDGNYVDAYYGPKAWQEEAARGEPVPVPELLRRARSSLEALRRAPVNERTDNLEKQLVAVEAFLRRLSRERMSLSEERAFGLDTSSVTIEKVPLIINPVGEINLQG